MKNLQNKLFQNKFFRKERAFLKPVQLSILFLYLFQILLYALLLLILVPSKRWDNFFSAKSLSVITGWITQISTLFVFLFGCHRNFVNWLFGGSFERSLRFHKFNGQVLILASILHTLVAAQFSDDKFIDNTGKIALAGIIVLAIMSIRYLRRKNYEIFYWFHIFLAVVYLVFTVLHYEGGRLIVIAGIGLFSYIYDLIDRMLCIWKKRAKIVSYKLIGRDKQNPNAILLKIEKKNFTFHSGQWVNICFPKISIFDWHPFSIASCLDNSLTEANSLEQDVESNSSQENDQILLQEIEDSGSDKEKEKNKKEKDQDIENNLNSSSKNNLKIETEVSSSSLSSSANNSAKRIINKQSTKQTNIFTIPFVIRGDWTTKVMKQAVEGNLKNRTVLIEGPLGKNNQQHDQFSYFVLVAAGSGIGPTFGYLTTLFQESLKKRKVPIKKVILVWASRNDSLVGLLNKESKIIFQNKKFSSHFYWTRQKDDFQQIQNVEINTGRPDFKQLIKDFKMEAEDMDLNKIAISICAPKSISKVVKKTCTKLSSSEFYFDIMNEIIEF
ncbi:nadph oxidase [Anaeramoeba flamelloides]|uniref:Nadph oxidase n=1 Tax=Anaeramoeba flamelloides TaxID=1746091 RepID=A0AAV7Y5P9_9EUKA|nr:nadph oxidase [Anaeramoeba flamelloides]